MLSSQRFEEDTSKTENIGFVCRNHFTSEHKWVDIPRFPILLIPTHLWISDVSCKPKSCQYDLHGIIILQKKTLSLHLLSHSLYYAKYTDPLLLLLKILNLMKEYTFWS